MRVAVILTGPQAHDPSLPTRIEGELRPQSRAERDGVFPRERHVDCGDDGLFQVDWLWVQMTEEHIVDAFAFFGLAGPRQIDLVAAFVADQTVDGVAQFIWSHWLGEPEEPTLQQVQEVCFWIVERNGPPPIAPRSPEAPRIEAPLKPTLPRDLGRLGEKE